MAIDVELAGLKAAGTYRFEKDLSTLPSINATEAYSNLRLIVGFSKKGPFNSVQLIKSTSQFTKLYGNIDRTLEKNGSYFHRSALAALSAGPILCLNLLTLDPEKDQITHRSISTNIMKFNKDICTIPYQTVYDTDKFWFLSSESYLDSVHTFDNKEGHNILNFTNVGNKPISVIVKKASAKNTKGYDVTVSEWFGAENVPEYLNGTSYISDYMVEVYVVGGNFGPQLSKIQNPKEISNDLADVYKHTDSPNDNPYKRFASDITYQEYFDKDGFVADKLNEFLALPSVNVIATYVGSLLPNFTNKLNQNIWIQDLINKDTLMTGLLCSEDIDMIESAVADENGIVNEGIDIIGHNLSTKRGNYSSTSINFLSYTLSQSKSEELNDISVDSDSDYPEKYPVEIECHANNNFTEKRYIDIKGTKLINTEANNEIVALGNYKEKIISVGDLLLSYTSNNGTTKTEEDDWSRLTRVIEVKPLYMKNENEEIVQDEVHYRVVCSDIINVDEKEIVKDGKKVKIQYVEKYDSVDNMFDRYQWTFLEGFKVSKDSMPDGTNERQNKILDMISEDNVNSNLYKALIDRDYVQWRYLVDTFGCGIEEECKKVYGRLCKGRQSGLALVNAPSMKEFKRCKDASFVDGFGAVKSEYIAGGGHLNGSPLGSFTLPREENGASWSAYFYPYLKISDLAAVKTVPPAAYVSNLYVNKYTNSKPWAIVAGPKRGVIAGNQVVGIECSLIQNDREYLEPMGINPIVWENGVGIEIFANKTAKQSPVSALSSIHAREACIYIQDNVEAILKKYNWEANTARNREEIKTLVDTFLSNMKQGDGLYDFKTVMDTTNNTNELIDRNMGVIDIYVEIVRGLEILAQRLTVLKTGSIESGNFE